MERGEPLTLKMTVDALCGIRMGKPMIVLAASMLLLIGCSDAENQDPETRSNGGIDVSKAGFAPEAVTLAPGVHLLGKVVPGNAYAVETSDGLVLIDCGIHDDASFVIRQLDELGIDVDTLHSIFITHAHVDHFQGAAYLRERTKSIVYAGAGDADVIRAGEDKEALFSKYSMTGLKLHPTIVDKQLIGGERIRIGDTTVIALAMPGHSPGSMTYGIERDGQSMLFTGDTISSLTGELGTYIARLSPRFRGDANSYLETFIKLASMPAPDLVFPGHTEDDPLGQSPAMNAQLWAELTERGTAEVQTILDRFENDGRDFLMEQPFRIHDSLVYLGQFRGHGMYGIAATDAFYLFDAPGGGEFVEMLLERLSRLDLPLPDRRFVLFTNHDGRTTANLPALAGELGFKAIVPPRAYEALQKRFPDRDLLLKGVVNNVDASFEMKDHELAGIGVFPTAYEFVVGEKRVVVSGRIPVEQKEQAINRLYRELTGPSGDPVAFVRSLDVLGNLSPNIWLPATIVNDQNANVYDTQWQDVLEKDRSIFSSLTN